MKNLSQRPCDNHGCGYWKAPRGGRDHNGVDLIINPGEKVLSPIAGKVTKLGFPYAKHLEYRYVEIKRDGYRFRFFYIDPCVEVGDEIEVDTVIGTAQDLDPLYSGITPHIHFEIKQGKNYFDPNLFLIGYNS